MQEALTPDPASLQIPKRRRNPINFLLPFHFKSRLSF